MYVQAGKLRHEITIESDDRNTASSTGYHDSSWSTFHTCFASIRNARGSELIQGGEVASRIDTLITIRYKAGLRANMRVKATVQDSEVRYYNIAFVNSILEKNEMIELACQRLENITNG